MCRKFGKIIDIDYTNVKYEGRKVLGETKKVLGKGTGNLEKSKKCDGRKRVQEQFHCLRLSAYLISEVFLKVLKCDQIQSRG